MTLPAAEIKDFYRGHNDDMRFARYKSPYPLRRYAHSMRNQRLLELLEPGQRMFEVGAGDGVLAVMAAKKGLIVTASDISEQNLERARALAAEEGMTDRITFVLADADHLPAEDNSFDIVVASHVLEHVPNFESAIKEVHRITRDKALIALPTILNPCAWLLLGGHSWWYFSKRSIPAITFGFLRFLWGLVTLQDWVDEGAYGGKKGAPHLWRFPWAMRKHLRRAGFDVMLFRPDGTPLPWFNWTLHITYAIDHLKDWPVFRELGYGSHALLKKRPTSGS